MIQICYSEMDGPHGPTCRLEAAGHAGYAPAGQDIVCAGASLMMQSLAALLAGHACGAGPRLRGSQFDAAVAGCTAGRTGRRTVGCVG